MQQKEGKFWTVSISDRRCRVKEEEAPLKSHLDARLPVQGRALWLPGPAWAHTGGIHSPWPRLLPPALCTPQQQTELSVLVPESSLHRINCNNWQVCRWLLGFNSPGAREKNWMFCRSQYLAWALRSFSFP